MAKTFPAIKTSMGEWDYFSLRVKFSDLKNSFVFASSLGEPSSLEEVMQREYDTYVYIHVCIWISVDVYTDI